MLRHTTILLAACLAVTARGAQDQPKPAVPVEATGFIVDAFRTHRLVGLSEGPHGNTEGHRFRLSLIRDPRFSAIVNDIVSSSAARDTRALWIDSFAAKRSTMRRFDTCGKTRRT